MRKKDYLIINRSKWRTGSYSKHSTGRGYTALLNEMGYMCCLGFRCHQMGIPKRKLLGVCNPKELSEDWSIPDLIQKIWNNQYDDSEFTSIAMSINDNEILSREERETHIIDHFKTIGVTVEFKGKYETN